MGWGAAPWVLMWKAPASSLRRLSPTGGGSEEAGSLPPLPGLLDPYTVLSWGPVGVGKPQAAFAVVKEYLSPFFLKIFLQKQCSVQPAIMLKAFPWKTIAVLRKKIYMGSRGCNEPPHSTFLGLGVVSGKWFQIRTEWKNSQLQNSPFGFCANHFPPSPVLVSF